MTTPANHRAIGWALLSQSIWLPLLAIDASDRWQERVSDLTPPTDPAKSPAQKRPLIPTTRLASLSPLPTLQQRSLSDRQILNGSGANTTGLLLNGSAPALKLPDPPAILRNLQQAVAAPLQRSMAAPIQSMLALARPSHWMPAESSTPDTVRFHPPEAEQATRWQGPPIPTASKDLLLRSFTRSELLGGSLSLRDIDAAPMSAVALAERARWASSADPMAPLPPLWRDPMRQALGQIPGGGSRMETARVVHVPSRRVSRTTEIPLALQSDGSVDILSQPDNPGVVRDIEEWSTRQQPPGQGGVQPAVVMLHPISEGAAALGTIEAIPLPIISESHNGIPMPIVTETKAGPRSMESGPSRGAAPPAKATVSARSVTASQPQAQPSPRARSISATTTARAPKAESHQSTSPSWETVAPAETIPFQASPSPAPAPVEAAAPAAAPEPVAQATPAAAEPAPVAPEPQPAPAPAAESVPAP